VELSVYLIVMAGPGLGQILPLRERDVVIGRGDDCDLQLMDGGVSRQHARVRWIRQAMAYVVEDMGSSNGTRVNGEKIEGSRPLERGDKLQFGPDSVVRVSYGDEPETQYASRMSRVALRDGLTGIFNRRYFDDRLAAEVAFARRHKCPLALLFIDIDHFKNVNDSHDHLCGDAVLRQFAQLIGGMIRAEDVLARYGGEEFAVICRETSETNAMVVAVRIMEAIRAHRFTHNDIKLSLTASVGVAAMEGPGIQDGGQLVAAADRAMLAAKQGGRDRIVKASRV
jgi:diguanylate cyclase (GGDEF)-like protein